MAAFWKKYGWIAATVVGSALFALGFSLFLAPNEINTGGLSGLAQIAVHVLGVGSVGSFTVVFNLPLFIAGGIRIGKRFFAGSLLGMVLSSVLIDAVAMIPFPQCDILVGALYGGLLCGLGLGVVFASGTSTGGSDILVRLLKLRYRNVPIGTISLCFDGMVVALTGIVFGDISKALYSGEGYYSRTRKKVVLAVVKKRQLAELKELVMEFDENAFVIVQEAHQVLGDGFSRYSKDGL